MMIIGLGQLPLSFMTTTMASSIAWLLLAIITLFILVFLILLPAYTILLAAITILRAKVRCTTPSPSCGDEPHTENYSSSSSSSKIERTLSPWNQIKSSLYQGSVYHIRQQPAIHAFKYPLYFSIVDLDEASELFGGESVKPGTKSNSEQQAQSAIESKGTLWPLSSLMLLRDIDHLKNGEGLDIVLPTSKSESTTELVHDLSMRERVLNLVKERTNGKLDLCSPLKNNNDTERRRILLVTHLMYYGYCFNPVSFYIILKPSTNNTTTTTLTTEGEEIEAVVAEVSNTPWNEMFIYVLHPDSVDTFFHDMYPSNSPESLKLANNANANTYRYTMHKRFHVSPFMTMDHDYDWKFSVCRDRLKIEVKLIKRPTEEKEKKSTPRSSKEENGGTLYFTAGFDIERKIRPTTSYPLQLAKVIMRFPIYCFIIQIWIHYEALRLLMKGVEFIPHPEGSETGASRVIAVVMRPVFAAIGVVDAWWSEWKSRHHGKGGKVD